MEQLIRVSESLRRDVSDLEHEYLASDDLGTKLGLLAATVALSRVIRAFEKEITFDLLSEGSTVCQ